MASCPCLSWSFSMRNSVRGWSGWGSNLCPSRICSARCSTWWNLRVQVGLFVKLFFTPSYIPFFDPAVTTSYMRAFVRMWSPGKITLGDLKRCRMAHIFFDTFFNLEKYLDHEQRDPFAVQKVCDVRRRKSLKHESVPSKGKKLIIEFENCPTVYEKWAEMLVRMGQSGCHSTTLWLWMLLNKYSVGDEIWKMIWFWWWWNDDYLPNTKIPSLALEQ